MTRPETLTAILNNLAHQPRSEALVSVLNHFDDPSLQIILANTTPSPTTADLPPPDDPALNFLYRFHLIRQKFGVSYEIIRVETTSPFAREGSLMERFIFAVRESLP